MQQPVVAVEVDIAADGVLGCQGFGPEGLGRPVRVGDGDVPLAGVGLEGLLDGGAAGAPAPVGFNTKNSAMNQQGALPVRGHSSMTRAKPAISSPDMIK